ncbi:MAG: glycogen synthase [Ruminococcaceae bacterium]|nr:glycogen synthase [Oscillospiraceae bacterium]
MKKVLYVTAEASPFIASGGLGDVASSLPQSINSCGDVDVRVILPLHSAIEKKYREILKFECEFNVKLSWRNLYCGIYSCEYNGVIYYFVDNKYYFEREMIYGSFDDAERYAFFCRAVTIGIHHLKFVPDILHANDWHTALTIVYLRLCHSELNSVKTVFTIHNIEYQGIYDRNISNDVFDIEEKNLQIIEYDGKINLLKGAIACCDVLTTVSPKYAEEIENEYYSAGLHHIIRSEKNKLRGIVNGIDTLHYNPLYDNDIPCKYSHEDLSGKKKCKSKLQSELKLKRSIRTPIIAMISRLAEHKGFDLVKCVANELMELDIQFVLLGKGDSELENYFHELSFRYPDRVGVVLEFDKKLSKKIYAGADIFLMPSRVEPCGLSQMIAARYGTIPVVRRTGGLYDTIVPYDTETFKGNGITFSSYNAHEMLESVKCTLELYKSKKHWNALIYNAMTSDFSWENSAGKYIEIYENLCDRRK